MENSVDKQELLDQFEQWRIDDGLPGEYSARPRQAADGQAADGQKGLSQQLFELCEEPSGRAPGQMSSHRKSVGVPMNMTW